MKKNQILTVVLFCLISIFTFGQNKTINTKDSLLQWTGKVAFNAYSLTGTLKVKQGEIKIENDSIKLLKIVIDMTSLDHENNDLKTHLKGKDFFEVKTYTEASFTVSQPAQIANGLALITGELKIKDVTKTESFTITISEDYSVLNFNISIDRTAME
jgi:polyisoprenoid-binding protein YceI